MLDLEPAILTIFGITGDLAGRKLLPAVYHLAHDNLLPKSFHIVGVTRKGTTTDEVIQHIKTSVENHGDAADPHTLERLKKSMSVIKMDIVNPGEAAKLKDELDQIEEKMGMCLIRIFYLAVPAQAYTDVVRQLGAGGLNKGCQHSKVESRLLVEKPFGYDLASAKNLIDEIASTFEEKEVYRIDHYLAKETVQNILTFRFENPLFRDSWKASHISHVMITAAEVIGIEGRVNFYEQMGALRDFVQSHLMQLLALVTMKRPDDMTAEYIHKAKLEALKDIRPPSPEQMKERAVRGQYQTYRNEVNDQGSDVETFAALHLSIDNDTWRDVPILLRTGKALAKKAIEITMAFDDRNSTERNLLTLVIQPDEGFLLTLQVKKPGFDKEMQNIQMSFSYAHGLDIKHPDAYERVIVDALRGDKTLFATSKEVLESWRICQPVLHAWNNNETELYIYKDQSWGPAQAQTMAKNTGIDWPNNTR